VTEAQRKFFYFPIWRETAASLEWRMDGGRLIADLDYQIQAAEKWPDHARAAVAKIITNARLVALNERRAVTADDLRHETNELASGGRTDSCLKFSQRDLNQFDRLCAVLRDPWDLTAAMAWQNPDEDDRQRTLIHLRKIANEARLIAICENAWQHREVDGLQQSQIDWLVSQVKGNGITKYPKRRSLRTANAPF
jgi:hypothetical protein